MSGCGNFSITWTWHDSVEEDVFIVYPQRQFIPTLDFLVGQFNGFYLGAVHSSLTQIKELPSDKR